MAFEPAPSRRRIRRMAGGLAILLLTVLLSGAGYAAYRINIFSQRVFSDQPMPAGLPDADTSATPTAPIVAPTVHGAAVPSQVMAPTPTLAETAVPTMLPYGQVPLTQRLESGGRVTILLLGLAGPGHDGPYLTDALQVLSFDARDNTATIISVPRDLWVKLPVYKE